MQVKSAAAHHPFLLIWLNSWSPLCLQFHTKAPRRAVDTRMLNEAVPVGSQKQRASQLLQTTHLRNLHSSSLRL